VRATAAKPCGSLRSPAPCAPSGRTTNRTPRSPTFCVSRSGSVWRVAFRVQFLVSGFGFMVWRLCTTVPPPFASRRFPWRASVLCSDSSLRLAAAHADFANLAHAGPCAWRRPHLWPAGFPRGWSRARHPSCFLGRLYTRCSRVYMVHQTSSRRPRDSVHETCTHLRQSAKPPRSQL
jgi:hypothetical protein